MYNEVNNEYPCVRNWYILGKLYYIRRRVETKSRSVYLCDDKIEQKISSRNRFVAYRFSNFRIHICTLDDKLLGSIISKEEIFQFGWLTESVIAIFDQNCVQVYDLTDLSCKLCNIKLPMSSKSIRSCSFDGFGNVFLLSEESELFVMFIVYQPQKLQFDIQFIDSEYSGAEIISALNKRSTSYEEDDVHYIFFCDHIKSYFRRTGEVSTICCQGNIICAEFNPGKNLLATCTTYQGRYILDIYSTNFLNLDNVIKVDMGMYAESSQAIQLGWCGENAVAIMSDSNILQLCNIDGGCIHVNIGTHAKIFSEVDGLHVVGYEFREFFQEVPSPIVEFRGKECSLQPFMHLMAYEKKAYGAGFLNLQSEHVDDRDPTDDARLCVCTALHEMSAGVQMKLLRAASCFAALSRTTDNTMKDFIHSSCSELRVLNSLRKGRDSSFTYLQFQRTETLTTNEKCLSQDDTLLNRITLSMRSRRYMYLQLLLRKYIKRKLSKSFKQDFLGLCNSLMLKHPSISLCMILGTHSTSTTQDLYLNIINLEHHVFWQLPALMNLRTHGVAFTKAFEFKDVDLTYRVLLCIGERLCNQSVMSIIESNFTNFRCSRLKYLHFPHFRPDVLVNSVFGYGQLKIIDQLRSDFPLKFIFYSKLVREFIRISKVCHRYADVSFSNSISFLLELKNDFEIKKFSSNIQISNRQSLWILARFYIRTCDWAALRSLVVSNKAELNIPSIVECSKSHLIPDLLAEEILRLSGRADYLAEIDFIHDTQEALQVASKSVHSFTLKATDYFEKFKMKK